MCESCQRHVLLGADINIHVRFVCSPCGFYVVSLDGLTVTRPGVGEVGRDHFWLEEWV